MLKVSFFDTFREQIEKIRQGAGPLPVGETGGSKGKGAGREGDRPFCTEPQAEEERGNAAGAARDARATLPRARGRRPLAIFLQPTHK